MASTTRRAGPFRFECDDNGSGAKYQGGNETFWEHQGEATITWGYGASEMRCRKAP